MPRMPIISAAFFTAVLLLFTPFVSALEEDVQRFDQSYYGRFEPVTASDILDRIPGAQAILVKVSSGGRGLNANSRLILINGQPVASKSSDVRDVINRIPASTVTEIRIIRGGVPGLDVPASENVLDIRLQDEPFSNSSWNVSSTLYDIEKEVATGLSYFLNRTNTKGGWVAGLEWDPEGDPDLREEMFYLPDGSLDYTRERIRTKNGGDLIGTWNYQRQIDSDRNLQVNLFLRKLDRDEDEIRPQFAGEDASVIENIRTVSEGRQGKDFEFSGQYSLPLSANSTLQLDWVEEYYEEDRQRVLEDTFQDGTTADTLEDRNREEGEHILRGTLIHEPAGRFSQRAGVELVYNTFEQVLNLVNDGEAADPSLLDVSERRAEANWYANINLGQKLSLEAGSAFEYSRVEQALLEDGERSFSYIKPLAELSWRHRPWGTFLFGLERTVDQLELDDFATQVNFDQGEVRPGNPNLEPQKAWEARVRYQRKLPAERGSLELQLFYDAIDDVVEQVPIDEITSALGNAGPGTLYGLSLTTDIQAGSNTQLKLELTLQRSEVTDPFTGEKRAIRNTPEQVIDIQWLQSFNTLPLTFGLEADNRGKQFNRRINESTRNQFDKAFVKTWLDWRIRPTLTVRFEVANLLDRSREIDRLVYETSIAEGDLEGLERFNEMDGRRAEISLSGQF